MSTEAQEYENATSTTETGDEENRVTSEDAVNSGDIPEGGEGDSSTPEDAFDASSYEESFGLPADTLKGVENAEDALEAIRGYTDKTLTAGLLSNSIANATAAADNTNAGSGTEEVARESSTGTAIKGPGTNPELDALRAELTEVKESLAVRAKKDQELQFSEINRRGYEEIDKWASPKYGTSKSRNFKQAQAVQELQDLIRIHISGFHAEGKLPPVVEKTLRQVRAHHDDEYRPSPTKNNSDRSLGSPGTGSPSTKKDGGAPKNIHEALQRNSY